MWRGRERSTRPAPSMRAPRLILQGDAASPSPPAHGSWAARCRRRCSPPPRRPTASPRRPSLSTAWRAPNPHFSPPDCTRPHGSGPPPDAHCRSRPGALPNPLAQVRTFAAEDHETDIYGRSVGELVVRQSKTKLI